MNTFLENELFGALEDFSDAIKILQCINSSDDIIKSYEIRAESQEIAKQRIDAMREKGISDRLTETIIEIQSNLSASDISEYYIQKGLETIRELVMSEASSYIRQNARQNA